MVSVLLILRAVGSKPMMIRKSSPQSCKTKAPSMDEEERMVAYRKISYEYLADKFAVEMFNKYAIKILAILKGTTQKEIKNRLVEVRKKVA